MPILSGCIKKPNKVGQSVSFFVQDALCRMVKDLEFKSLEVQSFDSRWKINQSGGHNLSSIAAIISSIWYLCSPRTPFEVILAGRLKLVPPALNPAK